MPASEDLLADLAQLVVNVGRLVRTRGPEAPEVVPLAETERQVMRIVDMHPGAAPSEIARRTRLQRTNVSTALRNLEDKGMISRTPTAGRGIAVHPTELAATNLRILRAARAGQLASAVGPDPDAVRQCVELLTHIEGRLTAVDDA
jgi:DNA-binding MarR family transcriptional regulator